MNDVGAVGVVRSEEGVAELHLPAGL